MNLPLPVNDMVGPSVPMKCGANGKTANANVCGPIFANFSVFEYLINLILVSQPNIELLVLPNLEPILSIHSLFLDFGLTYV